MRQVVAKWTWWLSLVVCLDSHAFFLIPYTLTILVPQPRTEMLVPKKFSVFVFLGNYYQRAYSLRQSAGRINFLEENVFWERDQFFRELLDPPYAWYEDRIREHPEIYGSQTELVIQGLRSHEFPEEENSSVVLITEHNDFSKPVAMLRVSLPNEEGLLASEAHFLNKGLKQKFDVSPLAKRLMSVPYHGSRNSKDSINLLQEMNVIREQTVLSGAKAEVKNFAMDPLSRTRFFPHLFMIARHHYMFHYGIPLPSDVERARAITGYRDPGVFLTELYLDCYGEQLNDTYKELGFSDLLPPLNNRHTGRLNLYFMKGDQQATIERHLRKTLNEDPKSLRLVRRLDTSVIQYDSEVASLLNSAKCLRDFLRNQLKHSLQKAKSWKN